MYDISPEVRVRLINGISRYSDILILISFAFVN